MGFFSKLVNLDKVEKLRKEKEELENKISYMEIKLEKKNTKIEDLILENDTLQKLKQREASTSLQKKQIELIEKNLRQLQSDNRVLKEKLLQINEIIPNRNWDYSYLVEIAAFYSAVKYKDVKDELLKNNINYVQELSNELFENMLKYKKNYKDAYQKYENFSQNIIDWETKTVLLKGDRVTKIYSRSRKFLNSLVKYNIEFMSDLDSFNFQELLSLGFSIEEIENFVKRYEEYNNERKIK